jgi:hypothetical protein
MRSMSFELPTSFILKRGTLFGAGLGMLAGLICLSLFDVKPSGEVGSIVLWRNCILIGAAAGLILSAIVACWLRTDSNQAKPTEAAANANNSIP